ncbi:AmpG family muropeptide MFS transporter [Enterovibrio nigricans]|uniref:MFS transporter, PAT family, beta-lactamase induction signal transducer AmpG n=1 Tax=Enterovibrio nigricans DSM 22720 TaxID=1121868 RepID=A0A1T4U3G7_9GAMM|nr:MFS transporter [Enterovibrio nigricans]PKF51810.1 MFS transporter [Enterovibrio nigricans]SKA47099.1 MFS transporter, PAT family, beta-lactamase induction signal transducer AmpG [Enterovibrio nigricans DSM 22720]
MSKASALSWRETLESYLDRRLLWVFMLGCASGFPWLLIGSNMSGWLKDAGLTRTAIGLFGSVFVVYAFNWVWAPLIDRIKLPYLHAWLGQRRSWIFLMQVIMLACTLAITQTDPSFNLWLTSVLALLIAIVSATQDIAIDAFRIDSFEEHEKSKMPQAAAMAVIGWWTGYSLPGYFAFINADTIGWNGVYYGMAGFIGLLILFTLFVREPESQRDTLQADAESRYAKQLNKGESSLLVWFSVTIVEPFAEFFRRNGVKVAMTLLLFVFLFKIGEAFLGRMSIVFYKEVGFSNEQIGYYSKLIGWGATVAFTLLGSAINVRFGVVRGLLIGGLAMAGSNLMFALMAQIGPNEDLFLATILVDNFTSAFATIAFVTFLTFLTGRAFSATQYALLASLGNLSRTTLSSFSGSLVDWIEQFEWLHHITWLNPWSLFFILTTLMVLPSLAMIVGLRKHFKRLSDAQSTH